MSTAPSSGPQRQMAIYFKGVQGQRPGQAVNIDELEQEAKKKLPPEAYAYLAGGAGAEDTIRGNRDAFRRWRIVPRFLRNVSDRDLTVVIAGQKLPLPFLLAPIGVQSILHKDAELAVARAAKAVGVPMILSTLSSTPMEQVAAELGETPRWFQLYWPNNDDLAASLLQRAEKAGYSALVVTLDTYYMAWRERDIQHAYLPFLKGEGLANYFTDPVFKQMTKDGMTNDEKLGNSALDIRHSSFDIGTAVALFGRIYSNPGLTWNNLSFLRRHTKLPILLKGILDPDDARMAVDHGVDGIIVSNHGGRQMDGAIAALDALPKIADEVGHKTTILFDSGIRRGADVFKAIALGAKAVLLGRPYGYGLAVNGEQGVREVLENFIADVDLTMALAGCASWAEVDRNRVCC